MPIAVLLSEIVFYTLKSHIMKRTAKAHWKGTLKEGKGELSTPSNILKETNYSFKTRFDPGTSGTNPEELIAAAHAGCFTMAVGGALTQAGFTPNDLDTEAILDLDMVALKITGIHLELRAALIEGACRRINLRRSPKGPRRELYRIQGA